MCTKSENYKTKYIYQFLIIVAQFDPECLYRYSVHQNLSIFLRALLENLNRKA